MCIKMSTTDHPPLTPLEAQNCLNGNRNGNHHQDGWTYSMEGPQMSPSEIWAPVACWREANWATYWFTTGEPGELVTEDSKWIKGV
jgi:hypothetical protein